MKIVCRVSCCKSSAHFSRRICATKTFDGNFKLVVFGDLFSFFLHTLDLNLGCERAEGCAPRAPR